ncbi:uncharacterized protein LOC133200081 [Saccostrea echinata]|uniref:uncharacterized protein LOC133200081 n=1 Tax=Saccostrea echinata TaxID=191078 RepID=UPI002A7F4C74|nr:uncharacterized protein LOC133200081 [Saccostrea echinata]
MGKLYDLLIEPFVNYSEKRTGTKRENPIKPNSLPINQETDPENEGPSKAQETKPEDECYACKAIVIATLTMYGTAILTIPSTDKYKQSMRKYLKNKNTVLAIFTAHSFFGCGCFVAAFYQIYKLKEMLDRRKENSVKES